MIEPSTNVWTYTLELTGWKIVKYEQVDDCHCNVTFRRPILSLNWQIEAATVYSSEYGTS